MKESRAEKNDGFNFVSFDVLRGFFKKKSENTSEFHKVIDPLQWKYFLDTMTNFQKMVCGNQGILPLLISGYYYGWREENTKVIHLQLPVSKAYIHFPNDPSVGMMSYGFKMEIPNFTQMYNASEECMKEMKKYRDKLRIEIQRVYQSIDEENNSCVVSFDDEEYELDSIASQQEE